MSVSVLIPAYNAQATIQRAIETVQVQTRPAAEIVIVDDASTDSTASIVRGLAKYDPRIKLLRNRANRGPSGSLNRAISTATGEWVCIHDADDAWRRDRLELLLAAALRYDVDVVADNMLLHDAVTDEITRTGFPPERGVRQIDPIDAFEQDVHLGAEFGYGLLQPMIRRRFLVEHLLSYHEHVRFGEDMLFLAELLFCGARAVVIPDPTYIYTTPIGEHSGKRSPHSKSVPRFDLLADGVDGLRLKYPQAISPEIDRAMTRLAHRYRAVHGANLARQERLRKGPLAYALYLAHRPMVFAQVVRQRRRALRRLLPRETGRFAKAAIETTPCAQP